MRRRPVFIGLAALAAAATLTACESVDQAAIEAQAYSSETLNDPVRPIGDGSSMTVEGFEWGFEIVEGYAVDGPVEVTFRNTGGTIHNFRIDNAAGETKKVEAAPQEEDTGTLELFSGNYVYYCDIAGHRAQGMEGEITVYATEDEAESAATETPTTAP
jgi:plastocyanin